MLSGQRVLITGASGYIGTRLTALALERGCEVVAAVRSPGRIPSAAAVTAVPFDLRSPAELDGALDGVMAVIHLAAVLAAEDGSEEPNLSGTTALLEAARRRRVRRFIFVSSQSAAAGSPTAYGRSKRRIEEMLTGPGEIAVRPGLVCGGAPRALYGRLLRLVRRMPLLPVAWPVTPVYPVHVDDLCACLLDLTSAPDPLPRLLHAGPAAPIGFDDWLRLVARRRLGRTVRLLPLPAALMVAAARLAGFVQRPPAASAERVRGLVALPAVPPELIAAGAELCRCRTDLGEALAREGQRRRLAAEGATLAAYVLGRRASPAVVGRYVRAVLAEPDSGPLRLPPASRALPCLVRLVDPAPGTAGGRYRRRLELATRIVEMTPAAAPRFHDYGRSGRCRAWLSLLGILLVEALILPLRAALGRLLLRRLRSGR